MSVDQHGSEIIGGADENPQETREVIASAIESTPGAAEETTPPASPAPTGEDRITELCAAVAELTEQLRAHHARAQARERVIDNLHAEVERLRVGEQGLLLRPVVTDLQRLRAELLRQAATLPAEVTAGQMADLLDSFALSAELALERCGSEPIRPAIGDPFGGREHQAVGVVAAQQPDQHDTIAAVIAEGYRDIAADRVTTAARVHVFRWEEPADTAEQNDSTGQGENTDD